MPGSWREHHGVNPQLLSGDKFARGPVIFIMVKLIDRWQHVVINKMEDLMQYGEASGLLNSFNFVTERIALHQAWAKSQPYVSAVCPGEEELIPYFHLREFIASLSKREVLYSLKDRRDWNDHVLGATIDLLQEVHPSEILASLRLLSLFLLNEELVTGDPEGPILLEPIEQFYALLAFVQELERQCVNSKLVRNDPKQFYEMISVIQDRGALYSIETALDEVIKTLTYCAVLPIDRIGFDFDFDEQKVDSLWTLRELVSGCRSIKVAPSLSN